MNNQETKNNASAHNSSAANCYNADTPVRERLFWLITELRKICYLELNDNNPAYHHLDFAMPFLDSSIEKFK